MSKTHKIAPASPLPTVATVVAPEQQPAKTAKAPVVALRGGPAISTVKMGGKNYRVTAAHNVAWWDQVKAELAKGSGKAAVADIIKAGVPATMVGYLVRRDYLAATE